MCGIAGLWITSTSATNLAATARAMGGAIAHRGPDDSGVWIAPECGIALSHQRLSILDISPEGHQPMASASSRYVLVYNGEAYNFRELKYELNAQWRGTSDTEVILAAFEQWGIHETILKLNGMFALAVWDSREHTLTLARDKFGEKPLYYGWVNGSFLFGSELSALRAAMPMRPSLNMSALGQFLRYSYVPSPHSIYEGIFKLPPASQLTVYSASEQTAPVAYWSALQAALEAKSRPLMLSDRDAIEQFESLLESAVRDRMISDVPLGAFLSGGIDSTAVVALMQKNSTSPIHTFTIGYHEDAFNEAPHAMAVASHLHANHHELVVTAEHALAVIPKLKTIYSEPLGDASQIPTYLVSQFTRRKVTVALSGDGGDELLGGYNRHISGPALWRLCSSIPLALRRPVIATLAQILRRNGHSSASHVVHALNANTPTEFYDNLCVTNIHASALLPSAIDNQHVPPFAPSLSFAEWMMLADSTGYFPNDIMAKVDRAAMAVSLETRTPFTDPALFEFIWRLPLEMKIRHRRGKWLMREMLCRHVPRPLIDRKKQGFAVPIAQWLRGPLKPWAEDLLSETTLLQQGLLNVTEVRRLWSEHQRNRADHAKALWNILMFQEFNTGL